MVSIRLIIIYGVLLNFIAGALVPSSEELYGSSFSKKHLKLLKDKSKEMFDHAWDSYLTYGFPADEVRPLSCAPISRDNKDVYNVVRNDVLGNFSVTVFDNLDSFIILGEPDVFKNLIYWIKDTYPNFDIDSNVQVFETNIRILGGLLSAHLYASDKRKGFAIDDYDGFLLKLAHDLGERLILAFDTRTSIPFPRTNLAKGPLATPKKLQVETCTAGAGSPILEFTLLSRLTGDLKFERKSRKLFMTLWNSRTDLNLLPMTIDPHAGKWLDSVTGIGASVDSFYEYALKGAILFDDDELFDIWKIGYQALNTHLQSEWVYENVDTRSGQVFVNWIDSLSAFWPGLQVLAGDISNAVKLHSVFLKIWETFDAIPERWNTNSFDEELPKILNQLPEAKKNEVLVSREVVLEWYPLRPEFIESTYHLYRATKDPVYLQIGRDFLQKLETKYKVSCGFSGMLDIKLNTHQDRMESFVLSETLKYLYLLFDEDNPLHKNGNGNLIFSTEAHPLWFDKYLEPEATGFDWFINRGSTQLEDEDDEEKRFSYIEKDSIFDRIQSWWNKEEEVEGNNGVLINQFSEHAEFVQSSIENLSKNEPISAELQIELIKIISNLHSQEMVPTNEFDIESMISGIQDSSRFIHTMELLQGYLKLLSVNLQTPIKTVVEDTTNRMLNIHSFNFSQELYYQSDQCILPTLYHTDARDQFLSSPFLSYPKLYHIDHRYEQSLIRPLYLDDENTYNRGRGANNVELSYDFYQLYTSHLLELPTSLRYPTTSVFEGLFDPREKIRDNCVFHLIPLQDLQTNDAHFIQDGDLYINELTGSRLRFEKLQIGDIDYDNNLITNEFIDQFIIDNNNNNNNNNNTNDDICEDCEKSVFRILKINGYNVPSDAIIWLNSNDTRVDSTNLLSHNNGHLTIDNTTVINFMLWIG